MAKPKKEPAESMKFESALEKLEKIVDEMESGNLSLDEILKKYEEGSALVNTCAKKLTEAEKRIEMLMKNKAGAFVPRPFEEGVEQQEEGKEKADDKELF